MKVKSFPRLLAAMASVAALTLGAGSAAQAHENIYWSVGIASPGVSVGVANAPPMPVYPSMYVQPYPVVVAPRPVYYAAPAPVYYGPPPGWRHRHGHGWRGEHGGHWGGRRDD